MASVYIHGTNGSGKTTLARALMICAGPNTQEERCADAVVTLAGSVAFIGKYRGATGGMDTIQPFAAGVEAAIYYSHHRAHQIVMESMVTPGLETCKQLSQGINNLTFFWLDTPIEQCIAQTLQRREARRAAGVDVAEFDPANLLRKADSVASWYHRLTAAGLFVERGDWDYVYARCKELLRLDTPTEEALLA